VPRTPESLPRLDVQVVPAALEHQPVLANLLELYSPDFSEYIDLELQPDGRFGYSRLPLYWQEPNRYPFLVHADAQLAGFVFVTRASRLTGDPSVCDMTEFFVVRSHRKRGVGTAVARVIWGCFPGPWEVRVIESNQPAATFWRRVTASFAGPSVQERSVELDGRRWQVFSFVSPGAPPA
jgi:predicted acetyltransferase